MDMEVDIDKLRSYIKDYYGTAAFNGFPAAMMDLWQIDSMNGYELCAKAEELGIDLRNFEID